MAATATGRRLTVNHRSLQLALRARFVRQFLALAGAWRGDAESFATLIAATIPLVQLRNQESSALAARYVAAFRAAELGAAAVDVPLAAVPPDDLVAATMWKTGQNQLRASLRAGMAAAQARQNALVQVSGATSRSVLQGGRETTIDAVQADRRSVGWQRVTASKPCAFCVTLASRGPVFRSAQTAGFRAHSG